jgi:sporulation protein YlmC with PRC-barrel domain
VAFIVYGWIRDRMPAVLAKTLSDKAVMGTDGTELGSLYNITMDLKTGALNNLLVSPDESTPMHAVDFDTDSGGRYRVPVERVEAVKDYIVVEQ